MEVQNHKVEELTAQVSALSIRAVEAESQVKQLTSKTASEAAERAALFGQLTKLTAEVRWCFFLFLFIYA